MLFKGGATNGFMLTVFVVDLPTEQQAEVVIILGSLPRAELVQSPRLQDVLGLPHVAELAEGVLGDLVLRHLDRRGVLQSALLASFRHDALTFSEVNKSYYFYCKYRTFLIPSNP